MESLHGFLRFFDPVALAIVVGGAVLAAALRSTRSDLRAALAALGPLLSADPAADALAARVAVGRIEALAQLRSVACADRIATTGTFLRRAALQLADATSAAIFTAWAQEDLAAMHARHARAADVWRAIADAAPAMGMVGTVIALVRMFAAMDDIASLGPAMALAMLTTLYGLVLGNLVAGPIAARLDRLSEEEGAWRAWTCRRLEALVASELDSAAPRPAAPLRSVK